MRPMRVMRQAWTAERSVSLGLAVSTMLKGYTTTAAKITAQLLSSVTKFAVQVRGSCFGWMH